MFAEIFLQIHGRHEKSFRVDSLGNRRNVRIHWHRHSKRRLTLGEKGLRAAELRFIRLGEKSCFHGN